MANRLWLIFYSDPAFCLVLLSLILSERRRKRTTTTTRTLLAFKFRPFPGPAFAKGGAVAGNSNPPPPKRSPSHFTAMWLQISVTTRWSHGCRQPQLGLGSLDRDGSCSFAIQKLILFCWIMFGSEEDDGTQPAADLTSCFSPPLQMMKK